MEFSNPAMMRDLPDILRERLVREANPFSAARKPIQTNHILSRYSRSLQLPDIEQLVLLQEYFFIPLDIFRKILHNKGIRNELEAWLAFLSVDEPEVIVKLIGEYPQFKKYYEEQL